MLVSRMHCGPEHNSGPATIHSFRWANSLMTLTNRKPGLDVIRVLAAGLVFFQHTMSSCQLDHWIDIGGFRVGRIGTSLFFLLAGLLAASSTRSPVVWFKNRLTTLFPPFWIVTLAGFALAGFSDLKSFDAWQVVCQMSGMGYFTHGERIINVATWFMSPLLILYLLAMIARLTHSLSVGLLMLIVSGVTSALFDGYRGIMFCHSVTFFTAYLWGNQRGSTQQWMILVSIACLAGGTVIQPDFKYGALGLLIFGISSFVKDAGPLPTRFAAIAYEWFLVHGLCISVISAGTHNVWIVAPVAAVLSVLTANRLKWSVRQLKALLTLAESRELTSTGLPQSARQPTLAEKM